MLTINMGHDYFISNLELRQHGRAEASDNEPWLTDC